jgi:hypothetical protein
MFQRSPDLVETVEGRLIQATCLAGDPEQFPARSIVHTDVYD